jgi:hypothetical protein
MPRFSANRSADRYPARASFVSAWRKYDALIPNRAAKLIRYTVLEMDVERVINDIEQLEEMFEAPDIRPLSPTDISAANRRHDQALARSPWFRLWQSYGLCCRSETPVLRPPE